MSFRSVGMIEHVVIPERQSFGLVRVFVELQQGDKGPPSGVLMLAPEGMDEGEEPMKTPRGGWTLSASPIEYDLQGWRLGKRYQAFASRNASRASLVMVHNADKSEDMDYEVRIKCANEFLPCPQPDMETECMGRGECKEERCACDESFAGIGCEVEGLEPLQLEESRAIDGHRAGEWRHFSVDIGNGKKSSSAVVTLVREAGDPVLFAKRAEEGFDPLGPPAVEDFTGHAGRDGFLARQLQHNVTVRAEQSATSGKAYVSVYNVARHLGNVDASYRLKVEAGRSCPFKCNGHGTCVSGQCQCDEGYAGPLCQGRVQQLRLDGTPQSLEGSDAVSPGEWRFLKVDLTGFRFDSGAPRKMLILDVERRGPSGSLILLMGLDQFPSLATFSSRSDAYMLADNEGFKGTREYRVDGGYLRNNSKVIPVGSCDALPSHSPLCGLAGRDWRVQRSLCSWEDLRVRRLVFARHCNDSASWICVWLRLVPIRVSWRFCCSYGLHCLGWLPIIRSAIPSRPFPTSAAAERPSTSGATP